MVEIDVVYEAGLHTRCRHEPSSRTLETDAPVDNHGRGESYSPTDLVATALGACMLTVMGILAERHAWEMDGACAHVEKHMSTDLPRRIGRLVVDVAMPRALEAKARSALENAAHTCPVRQSLHPEIDVDVRFDWSGEGAARVSA